MIHLDLTGINDILSLSFDSMLFSSGSVNLSIKTNGEKDLTKLEYLSNGLFVEPGLLSGANPVTLPPVSAYSPFWQGIASYSISFNDPNDQSIVEALKTGM